MAASTLDSGIKEGSMALEFLRPREMEYPPWESGKGESLSVNSRRKTSSNSNNSSKNSCYSMAKKAIQKKAKKVRKKRVKR